MAVTFASLDVHPVGGSIVGTAARGCATCHIPAVTDGTLDRCLVGFTTLAALCAELRCQPGDLLSFEP